MSVAAFILEAQNDFEKSFYIPVATESFFYAYWVPGIEALNLRWLMCIQPGLDVTIDNLPIIFAELVQLKNWAEVNLIGDVKDHFFTRAHLLEKKLPAAFRQRKDAVAFIG